MSWKKGSNGGRSKRAGWSGARDSRGKPLHRWQDTAAADPGRPRSRPRARWLTVTVMAAALLTLFVWMLMRSPRRPPLVIVTATEYAPPIPVNSWALEDRAALKKLHRECVLVADKSEVWNGAPGAATTFLPEKFKPRPSRDGEPLILYISMHGIVDHSGRPCLLPPRTSIHNPTGWRPVERLLDEIEQRVHKDAPQRNVLLVLDCQRIRTNWSLGIIYNSFVERLEELFAERRTELLKNKRTANLAVLTSAGRGEAGWASADLRASAFGRFFALGLAGDADYNGNGEVSLRELSEYLRREVADWARSNRGEAQTPVLFAQDNVDFRVTRVREGVLNELKAELADSKQKPELAVPIDNIEALWSSLDELRDYDIVRFDPAAYRDFEHGLLRVEELSQAGSAYSDKAKELEANLRRRLSQALDRARKSKESRALAVHLGITSEKPWARVAHAAHNLPAGEYFGEFDSGQVNEIQARWQESIKRAQAGDGSTPGSRASEELAGQLFETQLLLTAQQFGVRSLWPSKPNILFELAERRNSAEALAVPRREEGGVGDERAHVYARLALDVADERRRLAEDVLFIGEHDAPPSHKYDNLCGQADRLYSWARSIRDDATAAFRLHDSVLAQTPYLAAWLCSPLAGGVTNGADDLHDRISRLIENAHQLGIEMNRPERFTSAQQLPKPGERLFDELTRAVEADLSEVTRKFDESVKQLVGGGLQEAQGWRAIEATLSTPLVDAEQRAKLLDNQLGISKQLHDKYFGDQRDGEKATDPSPGTRVAADEPSFLEALNKWEVHPLLAVLGISRNSNNAAEAGLPLYDAQAAQVRARLAAIPARGSMEISAADESDLDAVARHRKMLSRAERDLRAAAAIDFDASDAADPISARRRFDLQQLLLWLTQRSLDDFWGDAITATAPEPFFVVAASDYLRAAESLSTDPTPAPALQQQIARLKATLSERRQAKCEPIKIDSNEDLVDEASGAVAISIAVDHKSDAYPNGLSAVYLADQGNRLPDSLIDRSNPGAKAYISLPPGSTESACYFALPSTANLSRELDAVCFFRGRRDVGNVTLPVLDGPVVDYQPHVYDSQSIMLAGGRLEPSSIVFILDCSRSMEASVTLEARRGAAGAAPPVNAQANNGGPPRMARAKSALQQMLEMLASRNQRGEDQALVGVRFFGHRVGWVPGSSPPRMLKQENYAGDIPANATPSTDIELVAKLGRFELTEFEDVKEKLDTIKPWGETPLFLSLVRALADFDDDDSKNHRSIIAITDGKNDQFPVATTTPDDVLNEWQRRRDVRIYIVGFDIPKDEADIAQTEYGRIAKTTGGDYYVVNSYTDLLRTLRDRLDLDGYLVLDGNKASVKRNQFGESVYERLNSDVDIPNSYRLPLDFSVEFQRADPKAVRLEGGEALALRVRQNQSSQEIVAEPYDDDSVVRSVLLEGESRPVHRLRVHSPIREKDSVAFRFSLQVEPDVFHFTARPVETWVEVTPVPSPASGDANQAYETYVFYDRNFEPKTPVPVLKWSALDWPASADRAEIRFWCKYNATEPLMRIPLRDTMYREFQPVRGVSDATVKVHPPTPKGGMYQIYIVEKHGPQSPGVGALRVHFETDPALKPARIRHQFDSSNRIATHTFEFRAEQRERIERFEDSRIVITAAADVKNAALHLPSDSRLQVEIGSADGLHTTARAGGGDFGTNSTGAQP